MTLRFKSKFINPRSHAIWISFNTDTYYNTISFSDKCCYRFTTQKITGINLDGKYSVNSAYGIDFKEGWNEYELTIQNKTLRIKINNNSITTFPFTENIGQLKSVIITSKYNERQ